MNLNQPTLLKYFFAASILVYAGMCVLIQKLVFSGTEGGFISNPGDDFSQTLFYALSAAAGLSFLLDFIVPRRMNPGTTADLVHYGLCESIAVYGLVFFLISGDLYKGFAFMGVGFLLLFFSPKKEKAL